MLEHVAGRDDVVVLRYPDQRCSVSRSFRVLPGVALSPDPDLAVAALMIARIEYPKLDAGVYLDRLDELGRQAAARVAAATRLTTNSVVGFRAWAPSPASSP